MFIAAAFIMTGATENVEAADTSAAALTDHAVIRVNNDTELAQLITDNSWAGDGSAGNPYVISGLKIDAHRAPSAIYIGNTTAHLIINGCDLSNSTFYSYPYQDGPSIELYNVTSVVVEDNHIDGLNLDADGVVVLDSSDVIVKNNTCVNSENGIMILNTNDAAILNNICIDNERGITSQWSSNCTVTGNICSSGTSQIGLYLLGMNNSTISYNNCSDNYYGIFLSLAENSTISYNNCSENIYGIYCYGQCANNSISYNTCRDCNSASITVSLECDHNTISFNTCTTPGEAGMQIMSQCNFNTISNNNCSGNYYGIFLASSNNNTMSNNNCSGNVNGIFLSSSNDNTISGNICGTNSYGIFLLSSSNNAVSNNNCSGNNYGIFGQTNCSNNTVSYNTCKENTGIGIYFISNCDYNVFSYNTCMNPWHGGLEIENYCDFNIISHNTCSNGVWGIYLAHYCCNNTISDNTCLDNRNEGICLGGECDYNTLTGNECSGNGYNYYESNSYGGIVLYESDHNSISDNICTGNHQNICIRGSNFNIISGNDCHDAIYSGNGIYLYSNCHNNSLIDNMCGGSTTIGIRMEGSYSNTISGNDCSRSTFNGQIGIYLSNSHDNTISGNDCSNNNRGIELYLYSYGNTIRDNVCNIGTLGNAGIYLSYYCYNSVIIGNDLNDCRNGIMIYDYCNDCLVSDNICSGYDNAYGICVSNSYRVTISNNECSEYVYGIFLVSNTNNCIVANNTCSDIAESGIRMEHVYSSVITNNTCAGSSVHGICIALSSYSNTISFNTIYGNVQDGIHLAENCNSNTVKNNTIYGNGIGIQVLRGCNTNTIINNVICDNDRYGIYISSHNFYDSYYGASSNFNNIYGNMLIGNNGATTVYSSSHIQAYDDGSNYWNAGSYGNYWNDWVAPDNNNNGIVDQSYFVYGGSNYDHYPLAITFKIISPESDIAQREFTSTVTGSASAQYFGIKEIDWSNAATGMSGTASGTNSWSFGLDLVEGYNVITVTLVCNNGMELTETVTIGVDHVAPTASITSPAANGYAGSDVGMSWTVHDNLSGVWTVKVRLDDGKWVFVEGVNYVFEGVSSGQHTVYLEVVDRCGNSYATSVAFSVDAEAPTLNITSPSDGYYNNTGSVQVKWTATDGLSGIAYYMVSLDGASWHKVTSMSYAFTGLDDGAYTVLVRAYDNAGNVKEASVNVTIDREAPTAAVSPSGDGQKLSSVITVEFSEAMDKSSVTIVVNGVTGTVSWSDNVATFTPSSPLAAGTTYTITVTGKDLAGNAVSASQTFKTATSGSISGRLVDVNGEPMANVTVVLDGISVRTDADGKYLFENVSAGTHELSVEIDGYDTETSEVSVIAGETTDAHTLLMEKSSNESNDVIIIAVVVLVAILALAGVMFVMKRKA